MKYKRKLMGFAALLIIIFHFWMPLTTSVVEASIYKCTYLGVDIFFLLSAYSLAHKDEINYGQFVLNRLINVYLPFVLLSIICAAYKKWSITQLLRVISGIDFFKKGGGAFLWFAVAIMLVYLVAPALIRFKMQFGWKAGAMCLIPWLLIVCVCQFWFGYTTIFILINRIPVFLLGIYYEDIRKRICIDKKNSVILILVGLVAGALLLYFFCGNVRLSKPITDIYYLLVIPFTLSVVLLADYISLRVDSFKKRVPGRVLDFIGSFTLELYGIQMIFGYTIETKLFRLIKATSIDIALAKLITFIVTVAILVVLAWLTSIILHKLKGILEGLVKDI